EPTNSPTVTSSPTGTLPPTEPPKTPTPHVDRTPVVETPQRDETPQPGETPRVEFPTSTVEAIATHPVPPGAGQVEQSGQVLAESLKPYQVKACEVMAQEVSDQFESGLAKTLDLISSDNVNWKEFESDFIDEMKHNHTFAIGVIGLVSAVLYQNRVWAAAVVASSADKTQALLEGVKQTCKNVGSLLREKLKDSGKRFKRKK
ncbi:MAG: hypothetical protein NZM26_02035, partial [Patescibacteria group bacterium]|nr:hypothetical protein [Patescibacteria group bacterium]